MGLSLPGRSVLLTGASGGIGKAIAKALHSRGASLVLSARRVDVLEAVRSELGDRVELAPADLSSRDDVRRLADEAGSVDVLVANAGIPASGRLDSFTPEEIDRALDVNLRAPIHLAHALSRAMVDRGAGHIVFVSSMAGKVAGPGSSIYSATKFGLRAFGFGLRQDLRGTGVGVTTVFPGFIRDAGMWADAKLDLPRGIGTRTPEQVAAAVLRGIEQGRAEVDIAPPVVRGFGWMAGPAPSLVAAVARRFGADDMVETVAEAQREKR